MIDDALKDKCLPVEGKLFSGGYALNYGGQPELLGKVVFLAEQDKFGWWQCFDRRGDMVILSPETMMPISDQDWDNKTDFDTFIYEARYGL